MGYSTTCVVYQTYEGYLMRVEKINTNIYIPDFLTENKKLQKNNTVVNNTLVTMPSYSYGREMVKPFNPSFTSNISKTALHYALQIPVEDRLASILQGVKKGDFVLLGQDYIQAMKKLRNFKSKITAPIKRIFYLPDNKLNMDYAFFKNDIDDIHLFNINKDSLFVKTGSTHYSVDTGKSMRVIEGNIVQYIGNSAKIDTFPIKDKPKADLKDLRKTFCIPHDYSTEVEKRIEQINSDILAKEIIETTGKNDIIDFSKIGGQKKAVEELKKGILYPIKYPSAFGQGDITRGYILYGPPGTGKTEISRALANEAGINYMYMSGTEFENKYVGESEANVRAFFQGLKENQPAIGVIDEIDAIGKERGDKDVYGAKVVNQILTSMTDLYNSGDNVFILGLTNKYETLDSAMKRSERFSKHIKVGAPENEQETEEILKIHTRNQNLDKDFDYKKIASRLFNIKAVGSDIKYISKLARENMMNRLGIYEKMGNGTFKDTDMLNAKITIADYKAAIEEFTNEHKTISRNPIGFNK